MPFRTRLAAFAFGVGFLAAVVGLLVGGWFLGLALGPRLERTSAMLVNLLLALTPAAIVVGMGNRKSLVTALAALALLLVVMIATLNVHAAVWIGPHLRAGSAARLLTVLSALFWPLLAAGAWGAAVSRQTGERFARTGSLAGVFALGGVQLAVMLPLFVWLAGTVPTWLLAVVIISLGVLLQFVLESEIALLLARRAAVDVPAAVARLKAEVEAMTKVAVNGPIVVDRRKEIGAEVRWRLFGGPVLILSAAMARLDPTALKAVIAHEYAHVSLGHLRMRLWIAFGAAFVFVTVATVAQVVVLGEARGPIASFLVMVVPLMGQRFVLLMYVRRQEREADVFAAAVAGADAMRAALRLTATGPVMPPNLSMWMTHDSPETRLHALEDRVR